MKEAETWTALADADLTAAVFQDTDLTMAFLRRTSLAGRRFPAAPWQMNRFRVSIPTLWRNRCLPYFSTR